MCGATELHEIGHLYGLADGSGPIEDCMSQGFYKASAPKIGGEPSLCKFSEENREIIRSQQDWLPVKSLNGASVENPASGPTATPVVANSSETCEFTDACDSSEDLSGSPGSTITDSCGNRYTISASCTLTSLL